MTAKCRMFPFSQHSLLPVSQSLVAMEPQGHKHLVYIINVARTHAEVVQKGTEGTPFGLISEAWKKTTTPSWLRHAKGILRLCQPWDQAACTRLVSLWGTEYMDVMWYKQGHAWAHQCCEHFLGGFKHRNFSGRNSFLLWCTFCNCQHESQTACSEAWSGTVI